jgi:hypothetical protein
MKVTGSAKKRKTILVELVKLAKKAGIKVSTGKLVYAGVKLKGGQCSLREETWLVIDQAMPFEEQVEACRQAILQRDLAKEKIPDDLKEIFGKDSHLFAPNAQPQ